MKISWNTIFFVEFLCLSFISHIKIVKSFNFVTLKTTMNNQNQINIREIIHQIIDISVCIYTLGYVNCAID